MLRLIEKDILFNWKWTLLMVMTALVMPLTLYLDRGETRVILLVYIAGSMLANSMLVSKSCYLDDSAQTKRFLASLPVRRSWLVLSKYVLGLLCTIVTLSLTSLSLFVLNLRPSLRGVMIASVYLLLYYAIFLGVFFRSDYSSAEKTNNGLMMLAVLSLFVIDRSGGRLDEAAIDPALLLGAFGLCVLICAASIFLSLRSRQ